MANDQNIQQEYYSLAQCMYAYLVMSCHQSHVWKSAKAGTPVTLEVQRQSEVQTFGFLQKVLGLGTLFHQPMSLKLKQELTKIWIVGLDTKVFSALAPWASAGTHLLARKLFNLPEYW